MFDVGLEDTAYPFLLFVSQAETVAVLNEHPAAQGIEVERGVELVAFSLGEQQVSSLTQSASHLRVESPRGRSAEVKNHEQRRATVYDDLIYRGVFAR